MVTFALETRSGGTLLDSVQVLVEWGMFGT